MALRPADFEYLDLLRLVIKEGEVRRTRSGEVRHLFAQRMQFNLAEGFPLLTTKRLFWKGIVEELLWMLRGETNASELEKVGVSVWREWGDERGSLGPVYGKQWRRWESIELVERRTFPPPPLTLRPGLVSGVGVGGEERRGREGLYSVWNEMLHRCYDPAKTSFEHYGAKGVHVDEAWHDFRQFAADAETLDGWELKRAFPAKYTLDKDRRGSNRYGRETCVWSGAREQRINTDRSPGVLQVTRPDGAVFYTMDVTGMCQDYGLDPSTVYKAARGEREEHRGFRFSYGEPQAGLVARTHIIDQIEVLTAGLRHFPHDRRHVLSAWNPNDIHLMALPPCHVLAQFHVSNDGRLDCQLYQRSADVFLGLPWNIAAYALLTHMLAYVTGLEPGIFTHVLGDVHLYENHRKGAIEQLERFPRMPPILSLDGPEEIDGWTRRMISLRGYDPHAHIPGEVAR